MLYDWFKDEEQEEGVLSYNEVQIYEDLGLGMEAMRMLEWVNARVWLTEKVLKLIKGWEGLKV